MVKKTLVILRWIAITGQLIAINLVYFLLNLPFPIGFAYGVIITGFITNLYLQFFKLKLFKFVLYEPNIK